MKLSIIYIEGYDRPYLIKRENGTYEQHSHMRTRRDAEMVRRLIDSNKYPYNKEYRIAAKRLLSEEEFKALDKKQRYYNVNKGVQGR